MFDDAEKKIARLIAESTTSGESSPNGHSVSVKGLGNIVAFGDVTVTINIGHLSPQTTKSGHGGPVAVFDTLNNRQAAILRKCTELGDPNIYQPFIKAAFKAASIEALTRDQLGRLEWWLGISNEVR